MGKVRYFFWVGIGASWALDLTPTTKFRSLDCQKIKTAHKGGASIGKKIFFWRIWRLGDTGPQSVFEWVLRLSGQSSFFQLSRRAFFDCEKCIPS